MAIRHNEIMGVLAPLWWVQAWPCVGRAPCAWAYSAAGLCGARQDGHVGVSPRDLLIDVYVGEYTNWKGNIPTTFQVGEAIFLKENWGTMVGERYP